MHVSRDSPPHASYELTRQGLGLNRCVPAARPWANDAIKISVTSQKRLCSLVDSATAS